jgi:hypothetical protein
MNNLKTRTAKAILLLNLLLCSGCFYLIEEGKGGTAERFNQSQSSIKNNIASNSTYPLRLQQCKQHLQQHHDSTSYLRYPARYHDISELLILSQRMHFAQFYTQAILHLQQAESLLLTLNQKKGPVSKAEKPIKNNS